MKENTLSIFALGGINEIGKNMYVIQYEDEIVSLIVVPNFQMKVY